jgi:hypothetical protein
MESGTVTQLENISLVLGVLGAYFAVLLVMAVSVETILEPFTFFRGLQKRVNPDDVLKAVEEWLPEGSGEAAKVVAIQTYAEKTRLDLDELNLTAKQLTDDAVKTLKELKLDAQVNEVQKQIAIKLSILRERYAASQKQRITLLRSISAVIGIILALLLQVNTFDILRPLFTTEVWNTLSTPMGQLGGMILTGLASSAGSSFWHDMLGRVRNLKEVAGQVESLASGEKDNKDKAVG